MLQDFRLKVFLKVASEKSFTKAAEALKVSQPAVSQNISELEKGLGVRLFNRLRGETLLTPEGEVFVTYARKILSDASDAELMFSPVDHTTVRVAASEEVFSVFVLPSLKNFMAVHPEVAIERSSSEDCELIVDVRPCATGGLSSFELIYKPTQAFALTKTCAVLKNILDF